MEDYEIKWNTQKALHRQESENNVFGTDTILGDTDFTICIDDFQINNTINFSTMRPRYFYQKLYLYIINFAT